jgi:hypothetical protein
MPIHAQVSSVITVQGENKQPTGGEKRGEKKTKRKATQTHPPDTNT